MVDVGEKAPDAFRTIGEVSADLGIPQHILRFWESKFSQLRPVKRSGNRRYYRPQDVAVVRRIDQLLNQEGYTIAGVQRVLRQRMRAEEEASGSSPSASSAALVLTLAAAEAPAALSGNPRFDRAALQAIRDMLADALDRTRAA